MKSAFKQHDIYTALMAASQGTTPNPYHLFPLDSEEDDRIAKQIIRRKGTTFAVSAGAGARA